MNHPTWCCQEGDAYCSRTDTFFGIEGVQVVDVRRTETALVLTVETAPPVEGCPRCGVVAEGHGRRVRVLHDIHSHAAPVTVQWRTTDLDVPGPRLPDRDVLRGRPRVGAPARELTTRAVVGDRAVAPRTPPSRAWPASSAWTGTPSGTPSGPCWTTSPPRSPASPA
jgi:transposase